MMEAVWTSETLVNLYQSLHHYNPEDRHLPNWLVIPVLGVQCMDGFLIPFYKVLSTELFV
jgi:hypothetical protein